MADDLLTRNALVQLADAEAFSQVRLVRGDVEVGHRPVEDGVGRVVVAFRAPGAVPPPSIHGTITES